MGRDSQEIKVGLDIIHFNPRARVGRDTGRLYLVRRMGISIHAPAWGATNKGMDFRAVLQISIHAPAWGATELLQTEDE